MTHQPPTFVFPSTLLITYHRQKDKANSVILTQYTAMDSSRDFPVPDYPNINGKNIPDFMELTRIVDLIQRHHQTLRNLEPQLQLEEAERGHDMEENHPKEQASVIPTQDVPEPLEDGGHTNRREASEKLERQGKQLSQARSDLEMLRGAVHPIRRSPTDILQHIFNWVVMVVKPMERIKPATILSHVCYRWRDVALNTSKFWSQVEVSLKRHPERIESFWTQSIERIRTCPAIIKIRDISDEDEVWERMKICRLDLIPNINLLALSLDSNNSAERLVSSELFLPTGVVGILKIERTRNFYGAEAFTIDLSRIVNLFPSLKRLWIGDFDFINFTASTTFPSISSLTIVRSTNVPLNLLGEAFPEVKGIMFWSTTFRPHSGEVITWPKLDTFAPYSTEGIPWHKLELPNLTELVLPYLRFSEGVVERLSAYPFLAHFHSPELVGYSADIIKNAPKIVCLALPASEAVTVLQIPCLLVLRLIQNSSEDLSRELLEEIISKHFLPSRQLTKEENQVAIDVGHRKRFLKISVRSGANFEFHWRGSSLLPFSLEESLEEDLWLEQYRTYCFTWE